MSWFYASPDRQSVAVPEEEIASLVAAGTIKPDTLLWRNGLPEWQPAATLRPDLFPDLPAVALPPAAAPVPVPAGAPRTYPVTPAAAPTSGMAIASLVCGILALTMCGIVSGIPAVVCGHMALGQIRNSPHPQEGRNLAIVGLVLGYASIAITLAVILAFFVFGFGSALVGAAAH